MLEIELPTGTEHVTVEDIPGLLALAICPMVPEGRVLSYIMKEPRGGTEPVPIGHGDLPFLNNIGPFLLPPERGASEADWQTYVDAFDAEAGRPDWRPHPVWLNPALNAAILRGDAERQHRQALTAAITMGEIATLNSARLPSKGYPNDIVMIDALRAYAARFSVDVRVGASASPESAPAPAAIEMERLEFQRLVDYFGERRKLTARKDYLKGMEFDDPEKENAHIARLTRLNAAIEELDAAHPNDGTTESKVEMKREELAHIDRKIAEPSASNKSHGPSVPKDSLKRMKKAALISLYRNSWPSIERDLQDASENGLAAAAKAGNRGWLEHESIDWARRNNKLPVATSLVASPLPTLATLPSVRHRIGR